MKIQATNIFIVDDNNVMVLALKQFLENRFGVSVNITTFNDGESCLKQVDENLNIVILDYAMEGKNGVEVLKSIKAINPKTEVIMLSGNEDMALVIESLRAGAREYVVKGPGSWKKVTKVVNHIITEPIRIMVKEFSISKFMAIFLLSFATIGIVVICVLYLTK